MAVLLSVIPALAFGQRGGGMRGGGGARPGGGIRIGGSGSAIRGGGGSFNRGGNVIVRGGSGFRGNTIVRGGTRFVSNTRFYGGRYYYPGSYYYPSYYLGFGYGGYPYYDPYYYAPYYSDFAAYAPPVPPAAPTVINQTIGVAQGAFYRAADYYLIAFNDHTIRAALSYTVEGDQIRYTTREHEENTAPLSSVDRRFSQQINRDRRVEFKLP